MQLSLDATRTLITITRKHGAVRASLFGSYARGDAREDSDLDVLVELEPGRSLLDLVRLERELRDALGLDVDVVTPNSLHPLIHDRVMAERTPIL